MPLKFPLVLSILVAVFEDRADLVAENIALRHRVSCLVHRGPRPKLRPIDRVFWVLLFRFWGRWMEPLAMVRPATVLVWHRQGFKLFLAMEE
jgi:putative transposase